MIWLPRLPLFSPVSTILKVAQTSRIDARTNEKLSVKVKQCYRSSRGYGKFFSGVASEGPWEVQSDGKTERAAHSVTDYP
jgi:hypothetical protein